MTTLTIAAARAAVTRLAETGDFAEGDTKAQVLRRGQYGWMARVRIEHAVGGALGLDAVGNDREGAIKALSDLVARFEGDAQ